MRTFKSIETRFLSIFDLIGTISELGVVDSSMWLCILSEHVWMVCAWCIAHGCESVTFFCFFRLCHFAWWGVLLYIFVWIWIFELYIILTIYTKISMRTTIIRHHKLRDISKKWCEGAHTILGFSSRQRLGLSTSATSVDLQTFWFFGHKTHGKGIPQKMKMWLIEND